jgi:streptomycin 6-kinase
VAILAERLSLDRARILGWYVAQSVLSVCWMIEDGEPEDAVARGVKLAEAGLSLMAGP